MIRLIEVKHYHISAGDIGCPDNCAIALALKDEYMGVDCEVQLDDHEPTLYVDDEELEIDPSQIKSVKKFIYDFDNNRDVEPFTLRVLEEVGA